MVVYGTATNMTSLSLHRHHHRHHVLVIVLAFLVLVMNSSVPSLTLSGAFGQTPSMIVSDPGTLPSYRDYPGCAWNVSAVSSRSSNPFMFVFGGEYGSGPYDVAYNPSMETSNTGSWEYGAIDVFVPSALYPTYTNFSNTGGVVGRWTASAHMTANGNIIICGGKVNRSEEHSKSIRSYSPHHLYHACVHPISSYLIWR